jgi:hypothetical protein
VINVKRDVRAPILFGFTFVVSATRVAPGSVMSIRPIMIPAKPWSRKIHQMSDF